MRHSFFALALYVFLLLLIPVPTTAEPPSLGPPQLVGDLERIPSQSGSSPADMVTMGSFVYFTATDPIRGQALWRSDGTAAGTHRVAAPCSRPCFTGRRPLVSTGDHVYFTTFPAVPGAFFSDLWATDGSAGGTRRIGRFQPYSASSPDFPAVDWLTPLGDRLLFAAIDREHGRELWITDGSDGGTERVTDLCPGTCSSNPERLVLLGDRVFFVARKPDAFDRGIWTTDGTAEGTHLVADSLSPAFSGGFTAHDDQLYFLATTPELDGQGLWMLERGEESPLLLTVFPSDGPGTGAPGELGSTFFAFGHTVYLVLDTPPAQPRIWRTDGTVEGTRPATEILSAGRDQLPGRTTTLGSRLLFTVQNEHPPFNEPQRIWVLNPGAPEARPLFDGLDGNAGSSEPEVFTCCGPLGAVLGERLILAAADPPGGLWVTDGTPGGTHPLEPGEPDVHLVPSGRMLTFRDRVLFAADDGSHGDELWITDATPDGTRLVADIAPPRASSDPRELTVVADQLFFLADERGGQTALWRTPVGGGSAELVADGIAYNHLMAAGDRLFLLAGPGGSGFGFNPVAVLAADSSQLVPVPVMGPIFGPATTADGRLFYAQRDELWVSDGTAAGTVELYDAGPGDGFRGPIHRPGPPPVPYGLIPAGDRLFFVGWGDQRHGLWKTDGTVQGTSLVADSVGIPMGGVALRNGLLFKAAEDLVSYPFAAAVWWSDGTDGGTRRLLDVYTTSLTATGHFGYFFSSEAEGDFRLWKTDGTRHGTVAVSRVGSPDVVSGLGEVVAAGERLFFTLPTRDLGDELWVSDGTAVGTHPVRDLNPGPEDSLPTHLTAVGDLLAFAGDDGTSGYEPWITDGSLAGTVPMADLNPGAAPSGPTAFAAADDTVWFAADDGTVGRELWSVRLGAFGERVPPVAPEATPLQPAELPGYRVWVLITTDGVVQPSRREPTCLPETVCISGAVPGRSELFIRLVGPKPNGYLWPTLVRFSTSMIDVWIEQVATGLTRYYRLDGVSPGESDLTGLFDRRGFTP